MMHDPSAGPSTRDCCFCVGSACNSAGSWLTVAASRPEPAAALLGIRFIPARALRVSRLWPRSPRFTRTRGCRVTPGGDARDRQIAQLWGVLRKCLLSRSCDTPGRSRRSRRRRLGAHLPHNGGSVRRASPSMEGWTASGERSVSASAPITMISRRPPVSPSVSRTSRCRCARLMSGRRSTTVRNDERPRRPRRPPRRARLALRARRRAR